VTSDDASDPGDAGGGDPPNNWTIGFGDRDAMTVGECVAVDVETASDYVGSDGPLDMVFHFEHMLIDEQDGWFGPTANRGSPSTRTTGR
jgi:hypothetical protein